MPQFRGAVEGRLLISGAPHFQAFCRFADGGGGGGGGVTPSLIHCAVWGLHSGAREATGTLLCLGFVSYRTSGSNRGLLHKDSAIKPLTHAPPVQQGVHQGDWAGQSRPTALVLFRLRSKNALEGSSGWLAARGGRCLAAGPLVSRLQVSGWLVAVAQPQNTPASPQDRGSRQREGCWSGSLLNNT